MYTVSAPTGGNVGVGIGVVVAVERGLYDAPLSRRDVCPLFSAARLWIALCLDKFELSAKPLPHSSQIYGFAPLCMFM